MKKNRINKVLAGLLAGALIMGMCIPVCAEEISVDVEAAQASDEGIILEEDFADAAEAADTEDALLGVSTMQTVRMYRMYNPNSGEHFYTGSVDEKNNLFKAGWSYEGTGWIAPASSKTPVYRLYNPNAGDHHYTTDTKERDYLKKVGWKYEKIGWYSDDSKRVPLYRQYNPNAVTGTHNYTTSKAENNMLVSKGWKYEGIGWYAISGSQNATYTNSELQEMAARYYAKYHNGERPQYVDISGVEGNIVTLHLYDIVMDHTATFNWYYIDRTTAKGTDLIGNEVNLLG